MALAEQPSELQEGLMEFSKMAKAGKTGELAQGFEPRREETAGQIERLKQVFAAIGQTVKGEQCEAIQGILKEGKEVIEDCKGKPALDIGLCGAGKAVEQYEIARESSLRTLARHVGMKAVVKLIAAALDDARERGLKVKPLCSFVRRYIGDHPETGDLLEPS